MSSGGPEAFDTHWRLNIPEGAFDDGPLREFRISESWMSHVLGVVERLRFPSAWSGSDSEIDAAVTEAERLLVALSAAFLGLFMEHYLFAHRLAQNTQGGGITANTETSRPINTTIYSGGDNVSLAANTLTLEAGTWLLLAEAQANSCGRGKLYGKLDGNYDARLNGLVRSPGTTTDTADLLVSIFTIDAQADLTLFQYHNTTRANDGLGSPMNKSGEQETYAYVLLVKLDV